MGEDLAALHGLWDPDRAVAQRLHLDNGLAFLGGGQRLQREAPDADAPERLAELVALTAKLEALGFLHGAGPYQRGRGPRMEAPSSSWRRPVSGFVSAAHGLSLRDQDRPLGLHVALDVEVRAATAATWAGTSSGRRAASSPTARGSIGRSWRPSGRRSRARSPSARAPSSLPPANPAKTATMMIAAPVMIPPVVRNPYVTASALSPRLVVLLSDPREEEHVVVHRQAEQDREQEQGQPRLDRVGLLEPECVRDRLADRGPALLEDQDDRTVRRPDGEQVHHDRLGGNHERPEHHRQQDERQLSTITMMSGV